MRPIHIAGNVNSSARASDAPRRRGLTGVLLGALLLLASPVLGRPDGNAGVLSGTTAAGSISVTVTVEDGRSETFTEPCGAGESTAVVMNRLAQRINTTSGLNLSADPASFTISDPQNPPPVQVDNIRIHSNEHFPIKRIRVDPDRSGVRNFNGSLTSAHADDFRLSDLPPTFQEQCRISFILTDAGIITSQASMDFSNGAPSSTVMGSFTQTLGSIGIPAIFDGTAISFAPLTADQNIFMSVRGLQSPEIAYEQAFTAQTVPGPGGLALLGVAGLATGRRRRR